MRGNRIGASVVGVALIIAAVAWFSWLRASEGPMTVKVGLSSAELCADGGCIDMDFSALEKMSGGSADIPWRVTATKWAGWGAAVLLLLSAVLGSRELAGVFVVTAVIAVAVGAWMVFGKDGDGMSMSWGWPTLVAGCLVGLGGAGGGGTGRG
jgi:hypothetical protein